MRYYKSTVSGEVYSLPESAVDCGSAAGSVAVVVIDTEDREQIKALMHGLWDADDSLWGVRTVDDWVDTLKAALRSLITPPKPEEPTGLGAVVEDARGRTYIRTADVDCRKPWSYANNFSDHTWDDIAAVKILSEGVR